MTLGAKFGPNGKATWFAPSHPQIDVAVIGVNINFLRADGIKAEFFTGDMS